MNSKDKPQPPKDEAPEPMYPKPQVGPQYNEEGAAETALIDQEEFHKANCFQPFVSADGQRVLFVSDRTPDSKDKPNNDIYVINADHNNLQRLTANVSDDTNPMWSPAERDVIFFLSTRGGATNIWRCKLVSGR